MLRKINYVNKSRSKHKAYSSFYLNQFFQFFLIDSWVLVQKG